MSGPLLVMAKRTFTISHILGFAALLALLARPVAWPAQQARISSADERARFLAGLSVPDSSPLKKLEELAAFKEQAELLAKEWQEVRSDRLNALSAWAAAEVRPAINPRAPVFYMFGGPDFLNAYLLYPEAPRYVLCGLETIGRVPPLEDLGSERIETVLRSLDVVLSPALGRGFFVTKEMGGSLLKSDALGVLPLLYVFVVRTGNEISGVQYVKLGASGELISLTGDDPIKEGANGVRIAFVRQAGGAPQELYYFRFDLSNRAIDHDRRFLRYLNSLGRDNCYLKAASYLMHTKEFSEICNLLLSQSVSVLQDDSGIPYHLFDVARWKIRLFGNYTEPSRSIPWAVQEDLKKAYLVPGAAKPLLFKNSYGTREKANLLLATETAAKPPHT